MTNPYFNYYQRPQAQFSGLRGFQVASVDEARAANIDFDGSVFIFPDLTNNKIYTKQIAMDGTLQFNIYELVAQPQIKPFNPQDYVTQAEFQELANLIKEQSEATKKKEVANKF